ncbi:hypothetical protein [Pseudophaeobacter sp.]|uniref:hypothetical protein n=1 Tax=Pseudophaeobacter sp. TaxID=1971739 RepID=UPI003297706C
MTEITKHNLTHKRFFLCLALAPVLTNVFLILLGGGAGLLVSSVISLFPATSASLEGVKTAALVLTFVSGFAVFFGFVQYFVFGGAALWLLARNSPLSPLISALLLFAVNLSVAGFLYWTGDQQFALLCLTYGSLYAPLWGAACAWLYHRSGQTRG